MALSALSASCSSSSSSSGEPPASANAKRYELIGKVVSVDKATRQVTIAHEEVPGFMDAMTMPFTLRDRWVFDEMQPGDRIGAILVVDDDRSWLESPSITRASGGSGGEAEGESNAADAAHTHTETEPLPGTEVPDFTLVNQDTQPIRLHQYRDRALVLTFIYTRCPLPEYCTLMSTNFAAINQELSKDAALAARTQLLSISIDPAHDTPQVMRDYGIAHTKANGQGAFKHWEFATGKPEEIRQVAEFFGLNYYAEADQIIHSLRTAVIAPDGKVFKVYRGNEWQPANVVSDLRRLVQQP